MFQTSLKRYYSMKSIVGFIALFHVSVVVATMPSSSRKLSPSAPEEASSPEPALIPPPKKSLDAKKEPEYGVFDVTEHGAVSDGRTESSSVCPSS